MISRTIFILFICTATLAHARLTEKEADLLKRFGKIEGRTVVNRTFEGRAYKLGTQLRFRSEQWTIVATMIDDRCAKITYTKIGSWTDEQIVGLLNRNGGYATFKEEDAGLGPAYRRWKQADGVVAEFTLNSLQLTHPLYERRLALLKAQAEAENKRAPKF